MLQLTTPITYAITSGATTAKTTPDDPEFSHLLHWVEAAVAAKVSLVQIREKALSARVLFALAERAAESTRGSETRLLVNDRFDVARAAGADGVHLTSHSLPVEVVRPLCGEDFVIGVSTHSLEEARTAAERGADFVVFGPVFETESKRIFGEPQGLDKLREVTSALSGFPIVAIGGIDRSNMAECYRAGAAGIAAIRLFK
ncbi:MAG TPA: thiamine phosphate synthase [Pyrinomonadaceae bacterium]|nr:thiamine phosphate synthase [Pyrinomonadaceae bacterium]